MTVNTNYRLGSYQTLLVDEVSEFGFFLVPPDEVAARIISGYTDAGAAPAASVNSDARAASDSAKDTGSTSDVSSNSDTTAAITPASDESTADSGSAGAANAVSKDAYNAPNTVKSGFTAGKRSSSEAEAEREERRSRRVLLPNRLAPRKPKKGDLIRVFIYRDNEERLTATLQEPLAVAGQTALLEARNVDERGAWMKWGLDKDLFVPYREQTVKMEAGRSYLVHVYVDSLTDRLAGSARLDRFLSNDPLTVAEKENVALLVWRKTDLGYKVIINQRHHGMIYHNEVFEPVHPGQSATGYIRTIRDDGNIDVSLRPIGFERASPDAERILQALEESSGFLTLHDKSDPEEVRSRLQLSKRAFKQAAGMLMKQGIITIEADGIRKKLHESDAQGD